MQRRTPPQPILQKRPFMHEEALRVTAMLRMSTHEIDELIEQSAIVVDESHRLLARLQHNPWQ
jgi:hypothetical protein